MEGVLFVFVFLFLCGDVREVLVIVECFVFIGLVFVVEVIISGFVMLECIVCHELVELEEV